MTLQPIGVVRNGVLDSTDENWGAVASEIQLRPEFAPGLRGLEAFSHVVIVFFMHAADFNPDQHLVRRPRGQADMPLLGIFAQRARHRPNPVGVTTARLERVEGSSLFVVGLDAIDGTPVLDIKPHVPVFDSAEKPSVPEWVDRLMRGYFYAAEGPISRPTAGGRIDWETLA